MTLFTLKNKQLPVTAENPRLTEAALAKGGRGECPSLKKDTDYHGTNPIYHVIVNKVLSQDK